MKVLDYRWDFSTSQSLIVPATFYFENNLSLNLWRGYKNCTMGTLDEPTVNFLSHLLSLSLHICECVCVKVCMCVYVYGQVCLCPCMCISVSLCVFICVYLGMHVYMSMSMYVHKCVFCVYVSVCIWALCVHVGICEYMYILAWTTWELVVDINVLHPSGLHHEPPKTKNSPLYNDYHTWEI